MIFNKFVLRYLATKWLAHFVALVLMVAMVLETPSLIISAFEANAWWIGKAFSIPLWAIEQCCSLLNLSSAAKITQVVEAIRTGAGQAYGLLVGMIDNIAALVPGSLGAQVEAGIRAVLAEGWILVLEISLLLRVGVALLIRARR